MEKIDKNGLEFLSTVTQRKMDMVGGKFDINIINNMAKEILAWREFHSDDGSYYNGKGQIVY